MIQGITFRLHDAMPREAVGRWVAELELPPDSERAGVPTALITGVTGSPDISAAELDGQTRTPGSPGVSPADSARSRSVASADAGAPGDKDPRHIELQKRIARYEDAGHGACWLREAGIGGLAEAAMLHFDGLRYQLLAWCVMPNHVHALIETWERWPLAGVVHSWKSYTAHQANRILNRCGVFWQREYHDRYIRNAEHYRETLRYIEDNPVKAGLVEQASEWPWSSRRFRGATGSAGVTPAATIGSPGVTPAELGGESVASAGAVAPGQRTAAETAALPVRPPGSKR
jgi:REP element-mobilizing transposase RayT